MNQALSVTSDFNESAKIEHPGDFTFESFAWFILVNNPLNDFLSYLDPVLLASDIDSAVVLDFDFGTGVLSNLLNDFTALADNRPDFFRIDHNFNNQRGRRSNRLPRGSDSLGDSLENLHSSDFGSFEGFA